MLEFSNSDLETIKEAEQVIIKNLNTLDEETRSRLFSRLQNIRFKKIGYYETNEYGVLYHTFGFFSTEDDSVYIVDGVTKNNAQMNILVHEILHYLTHVSKESERLVGFHRLRLKYYDNYLTAYFNNNIGINEGLTEFFACDFLNNLDSESAYIYEIQTVKILSEVCGKENLKRVYFNNDFDGFRKLIKNKYHLKDYALVDKLLNYIDLSNNSVRTSFRDRFKQPIIKSIYETLLQMEINRRSYLQKKDVILSDDEIRHFLNRFYSNQSYAEKSQSIIENIVKNKHLLYLNDTNKHDNKYYQNLTSKIVNALYDENKLMLYFCKRRIGKRALNVINTLNQTVGYKKLSHSLDNSNNYKKFLDLIADKNGKINLDNYNKREKYEFLTNVLYTVNTSKENKDYYKYFKTDDLVEYINNNLEEYKLFCNPDAMSYIYEDFDKVSPEVKEQQEFIAEYYNLRYGTRDLKLLKNKT